MKRMYEFVCESGQRIERYTSYEDKTVSCNCGKLASRVISATPFRLEGWSGHFPTAFHQFDKKHRDKLKSEQKANR